MADSKWISKAIQKKGSLTRQAKTAGKTIDDFCSQKDLSTKTKKRCVLKKTLQSFKK